MKPHYSNTNNPIDFPKSKNKMNEQIKAGADIHAGDGGYSEGTQEQYDAFVKVRNKSLAQGRIRELAEQADEYAEQTVHYYQGQFDGLTWEGKIKQTRDTKFAELIVRDCALTAGLMEHEGRKNIGAQLLDNFEIEH
jgi:hypothetical protein